MVINPDEFEPKKRSAKPRDLQTMSVEELEGYIGSLEQEIVRADAMIAQKLAHKSGIEALFGKSSD